MNLASDTLINTCPRFALINACPRLAGAVGGGCHPRYYHPPDCLDQPDGYTCECGPGFIWNTDVCVGECDKTNVVVAAAVVAVVFVRSFVRFAAVVVVVTGVDATVVIYVVIVAPSAVALVTVVIESLDAVAVVRFVVVMIAASAVAAVGLVAAAAAAFCFAAVGVVVPVAVASAEKIYRLLYYNLSRLILIRCAYISDI